MKVLHLISGGEKGGSKNHLLTLALQMKRNNSNPIIVCLMEGPLYNEAKKLGIDVRLVKQSKRFDLSIISKIKEICEREKVDIVNCHGGRANFIGYFLKKSYSAKFVSTVHSDYRDDYRGNFYKTLIFSNINRLALKSFDYLITVSDNFKEMLISRGFDNKKIFVVYNGIDFNEDKKLYAREEVIGKYKLRNTSHYVSMVARFHPVKGHRIFLDACKEVLKYTKDVTFILAGDGDLRDNLEAYTKELGIENNIFFAGFTNPEPFFSISDFTVLTSYTESFPLCILESAHYMKTVVSTDVGGISKLIEDGINGYLINPGDSRGLAQKMLELIENCEKAQEMGVLLYNKARDNFSIEKLLERYMEIYSLIKNGGKISD